MNSPTVDDELRNAMYALNRCRDLLPMDILPDLVRIRDSVCDLRIKLDPTKAKDLG